MVGKHARCPACRGTMQALAGVKRGECVDCGATLS